MKLIQRNVLFILIFSFSLLLLQGCTPPSQDSQGGSGQMYQTLLMFGAIFAIFYFMIIRPQQKRAKETKKMLEALQKGDKVMLSSGMHGTVAGLDEKTVLVEVAKDVKIKFERVAVTAIIKE